MHKFDQFYDQTKREQPVFPVIEREYRLFLSMYADFNVHAPIMIKDIDSISLFDTEFSLQQEYS